MRQQISIKQSLKKCFLVKEYVLIDMEYQITKPSLFVSLLLINYLHTLPPYPTPFFFSCPNFADGSYQLIN